MAMATVVLIATTVLAAAWPAWRARRVNNGQAFAVTAKLGS